MTIPNQNTLGYLGVKQKTPPNVTQHRLDPLPQNIFGFDIGDIWINTVTHTSWILMSKAGGIGDWVPSAGGSIQVKQVTGNAGIASPVNGNINIQGVNGITTAGAGDSVSIDNSSLLRADDATLASFVGSRIDVHGTNGIGTTTTAPNIININNTSTITTGDANATSYVAGNLLFTNTNGLSTTQVGAGNIGVGIAAPISIANGGTNAVAMGTNTGIVKYDGTSLVPSTTALIDANNIYTNTSQPVFFSYLSATTGAVTGDGTYYTILFDMAPLNRGSCYNPATGIFTAPKTGIYSFTTCILINSISVTNTNFIFFLQSNLSGYRLLEGNAQNFHSSTGEIAGSGSIIQPMTAGDTMDVMVFVEGSMAADVKVFGGALPSGFTCFSGCLLT